MRHIVSFLLTGLLLQPTSGTLKASDTVARGFVEPPDSARPGVYWYFMDGNVSREGMTRDLESMKAAGIGHLVFLEVNVGVPRGKVDFLSEQWQELYVHAVREAERLGIEITLGSGPGWTGSGGPWVKPEQSMQHLVASKVEVRGPGPDVVVDGQGLPPLHRALPISAAPGPQCRRCALPHAGGRP